LAKNPDAIKLVTVGLQVQTPDPGLAVVNGLEIMEAQPLGEVASIDLVILVATV
jgi:hypothetical protein